MGLKTLKDLINEATGENDEAITIDTEKLKQEAIKWIKAIQNSEYPYLINGNPNIDADDVLINFFNIIEEELK